MHFGFQRVLAAVHHSGNRPSIILSPNVLVGVCTPELPQRVSRGYISYSCYVGTYEMEHAWESATLVFLLQIFA